MMRLATLIDNLPVRLARGSGETAVGDVVEHSSEVAPKALFVARSGARSDGREFITEAIERGAAAVLTAQASTVPEGPAVLIADDVSLAAALLAERFHGNPSSKLTLIGITGTNGKTTTAHLVHQMLNHAEAMRCGLIGTVQIDDGRGVAKTDLTTPPAVALSRLMGRMVTNGCSACVMEVSSHALHQRRVAGLAFDVGVFTNLTGDHMDYHGSAEEYLAAKLALFAALPEHGWAIVNDDDPAAPPFRAATCATVISCSVRKQEAPCRAAIIRESITGVDAVFRGPWGEFEFTLPLCGRHNVMNALQAAAVGHVAGLEAEAIRGALLNCKAPPGRLEPVTGIEDPFSVFVDYAHTDDALDNVLAALRPLVPTSGKLRVVFGCGGDRDRTKRPRMAQAACRWADEIIITSDNPRTEEPELIVREIEAGVPDDRRGETSCIVDRREAILEGVSRCGEGDVLLIAGKGHEDYQIIGAERRPFDDRRTAREALVRLAASPSEPVMPRKVAS